MGVAVLPPQDCLSSNHHHRQMVFPANKPCRNLIPNPNTNRSSRRRRNSPPPAGNQTRPKSPPVAGHIRILKRGEDVVSPARRPEPARKTDGFFAGSTVTSPPPSSVPLPVFFTAKRNCALSEVNNLEIESELKRVLRLC